LARKKFRIPGVSFSLKRALKITSAKQRFARKTGIPTTRAGLERKIGRSILKGCCLMNFAFFMLILFTLILISMLII
jgi:hypothetical protein